MSNIIRLHSFQETEKRVIVTKKIEIPKPKSGNPELSPEQQRQILLKEIESLEAQSSQLREQLTKEQETARAEIQQWREQSRQEAEHEARRLGEKAAAKGYQTGVAEGLLQAEEEFRQQRRDMEELVTGAYEEKTKIIQQAEPFLLKLGIKIAEKIIKNELRQHDDQLLHIVKQALKAVEESDDVIMHVSLEDFPVVSPFLEELKPYIKADAELKLIPVANLTKGGCMIHTANGSYDVTVDSQLKEIKKCLLAYCEEKVSHELEGN